MVPGERTVTVAVGHGKQAARHIDAWLRGGATAAGAAEASSRQVRRCCTLPIYSDVDPKVQREIAVWSAA